MEEWRPISWADGYEVSSEGRIRRKAGIVERRDGVKRNLPERILGFRGPKSRYKRATFWIKGHQETSYVHRLVAEAFIGPCPFGSEVNHQDGDPSNNRAENLEYVSHGENMQHFHLRGRGIISGKEKWDAWYDQHTKLREVDVRLIRLACDNGFPQMYLAKLFSVRQSTIEKVHLGLRWRHVK